MPTPVQSLVLTIKLIMSTNFPSGLKYFQLFLCNSDMLFFSEDIYDKKTMETDTARKHVLSHVLGLEPQLMKGPDTRFI
jgi:hypothetical protein